MSSVSSQTITLKTNLADSAVTKALKEGTVSSPVVSLDFCGPKVAHDGFKAMLRDGKFDAGELAIVTYLQAKIYKKPFALIPFPVSGKAQHPGVGYNTEFGQMKPKDIEGKKVGVRTYSQTTGLWLRGILQHDHDVDLNKVTFLTTDVSHLAEYQDPSNCRLLPEGANLGEMLLKGEIAAGMLGMEMPKDPRIATLIPNAKEEGEAWIRRTGIVPINHLFVVRTDLAKERPDAVREIYRMLVESRNRAPESATSILPPYGFNAIRRTIELAIDLAYEQKIIPRRLTVEELFDETTGTLN